MRDCLDRIEVHQPQPDELQAVADLRAAALGTVYGEPVLATLDEEDSSKSTVHLAAYAWDEPISTLRLEIHPEHGPYIRRMATRADHRDHGHGRDLLDRIAMAALNLGVPELRLHARPGTEGFYLRCGYVAVAGEANVDHQGRSYLMMVRSLDPKILLQK